MKALKEIIEIIMTDTEDYVSSILSNLGLDDFDEYVQGPSRDESNKSLCIMIDPDVSVSETENNIAILFYLQLFRVDYLDALEYADAVLKYIKNFDVNLIGMSYIDNITLDVIPVASNSHTLVYISVLFSELRDSCDN